MKCEIHITVGAHEAKALSIVAAAIGWHMSQIVGDPVLGEKTYCYLNGVASDMVDAMGELDRAMGAVRKANIFVIRGKIEIIAVDHRFTVPGGST